MTIKTKYVFHPFEISLCGHSNSGKTTLITKLISHFSKRFDVGYIKHDAHRFEMDREGKDTYLAKASGAKQVAISSPLKSAFIFENSFNELALRQIFLDSDIVLIEGYKDSLANKILLWKGGAKDEELLAKYRANPEHQLLAIVGTQKTSPCSEFPYFERDDLDSITKFIEDLWQNKINQRKLNGLILTGGKSSRMGTDKGALEYYEKNQIAHLHDLLEGLVDNIFVSCRFDQTHLSYIKPFQTISDRFIDFGPTGGILSAFQEDPDAAWIVLACDMPFLSKNSILELLEKRNPFAMASCYYNGEKKWPEPLYAIYEPKAAQKLGSYLALGKPCPRKVLMNSRIELLKPVEENILKNANTPEDFSKLKNEIGGIYK